jgi:glycosyltransferase involved in cell wall biosynthesis
MSKPMCVIQSPLETRSGYGDMARDIIRHIIDLDLYDVKLVSLPWGATPMNALDAVTDAELISRIVQPPIQLERQPELFIQISVPNEFQPMGKYNIGITAGIETTLISVPWIEGCNRMNVIWTISEHSKQVILSTQAEERSPDGAVISAKKVTVPVEVLHNCVHTDVFKKIASNEIAESINDMMIDVKEKFAYLFVGHWLKGNMGEDRKNVGILIKVFCETFKQVSSVHKPALILKTSGAGFSILDREDILSKIKQVRGSVGAGCPSVYLIHGELTEAELNGLYNHPKVKVHVSFTKGEGFGRPLLEATMSQKPVIASAWSGHLDFLNPEESILIPGELRPVEPGAVWENVIIPQSSWFNVDTNAAANALMWTFRKYDQFVLQAKKLAAKNRERFSYDAIKKKTAELLEKYVPKMATQLQVTLPQLKKIGGTSPVPVEFSLPTLKKMTPIDARSEQTTH